MGRARTPRVEGLEGRMLLTAARRAAPATAPIAIVGTLKVDTRDATQSAGMYNTFVKSTPIAGDLSGLGRVSGTWRHTVNIFGGGSGPDVLTLRNAEGTAYLTFDNENPGPARRQPDGTIERVHTQHLYLGTDAYAHSSEVGTVAVVSNKADTTVTGLTLASKAG